MDAEAWRNIDQVHELVKQEGDAKAERAFDDLLSHARALDAEVARLAARNRELRDHHNALACVYCTGPLKERAEAAEARLARVREIVDGEGDQNSLVLRLRAALADAGGRKGT